MDGSEHLVIGSVFIAALLFLSLFLDKPGVVKFVLKLVKGNERIADRIIIWTGYVLAAVITAAVIFGIEYLRIKKER